MSVKISVFNNKGGVGKTVISWNLADALGRQGKQVLLVDFDPQCNLSIGLLGEDVFVEKLPNVNTPYGATLRAYLQRFLQNTGDEEVILHNTRHSSENVCLVAGDFWVNVYSDSLSVGGDLLAGTGLAKYAVIDTLIKKAESDRGTAFDFVIIDLPPSFNSLVRSALYSSDYFVVPCTSDNFSVYCVGLIGQMIPVFIDDWNAGHARFKTSNPRFDNFDALGRPKFAGWVFNGFDTARPRRTREEIDAGVQPRPKEMVQADQTFHDRLRNAVQAHLIVPLRNTESYNAVADGLPDGGRIGDIEDGNVLVQNSLWQNVPLGQLHTVQQLTILQERTAWAANQLEQIELLGAKFKELANNVVDICV